MDVKAAKSLSKNTMGNGHDLQDQDKEMRKAWNTQIKLSPIIGIMYALVMSLTAFDLIMFLDPHWLSTLFGAYYFMGSFYSALAALCLLSFLGTKYMGMERYIRPKQFHDLGKLLLGFCLVTGDFFYSQFLVIWYGNLTEETQYVILRVRQAPWETLAWIVLALCFVGPFVVLLSRKIKLNPAAMAFLGVVILGGMWLERYLLVVPSLWEEQSLPLGVPEILITAGYAGAMGLTVLFFLKKFPLLPISDPLYCEMRREAETENT
jgi:hypothetical protein